MKRNELILLVILLVCIDIRFIDLTSAANIRIVIDFSEHQDAFLYLRESYTIKKQVYH